MYILPGFDLYFGFDCYECLDWIVRYACFSGSVYGIGFGSVQPVLQATIVRLVPPDRRGVANASFSTATDLGIGLDAIILGWILKYTSYQILFTIGAVSVIFSLLVFVFCETFVEKQRASLTVLLLIQQRRYLPGRFIHYLRGF